VEVEEAEIRPLPRNDRDAQRETIARAVRPVIEEEGVRVERRERRRERRPEGAEILREMGDRLILQFGDQVLVESDDRRRLSRGAREVYTEELRDGRTRETVIRPNGTRIVTIRNVYGDVIRRSRFTPDGYEQVLFYVDESDYDRLRDWRDPGLDLPPIRIDIPEDEYILDASSDYGADDYYEFLDQPPVEHVQRLYSVDEVKRSARVRDITRRVDLDTITFEFGSASIAESEIERLEGLANAMDRLLKENPAETFLIEGHTDAVGSNLANLALSDRRAEAVAQALTDVFGLPPENLTTQGYGEEYLKIDTDEPERENRRVAVRRITPLVAPVASAD
jgi:outer membrane protein OmpA-like peptidoglycan-associated protein